MTRRYTLKIKKYSRSSLTNCPFNGDGMTRNVINRSDRVYSLRELQNKGNIH